MGLSNATLTLPKLSNVSKNFLLAHALLTVRTDINHYYGNGSVKHVTRNLSKRAFLIARGLQADPYDSTGTTEDQPTPAFTELSFTTITERSNMDEPAEFCYRCDHINSPDDDVGSEGYEDPPTDDTCDPIK